ncbi:MAG TPA: hypothetical protein DDZ68_16295 [Parvularcula sp.]|nr:hypothetical protein [Parvularcula sp.]HBS35444.1 hypothetical protein [Parvularcula sp.]
MIFFFITKPAFTPEDWRALQSLYRERGPAFREGAGVSAEISLIASAGVYLGPNVAPGDDFAAAVESAFVRGRAAPGLFCRRPALAARVAAELGPALGVSAPIKAHVWAVVMKSGVVTYLTAAQIADGAAASAISHLQAKLGFESLVRGALHKPFQRDLEQLTQKSIGAAQAVSLDFSRAPSFVVAIYDEAAAAKADVEEVHRLEDGAAQDRTDALALRNLGVSRAFFGFGNASIVIADPRYAAALLPPIVFVDSLFSLNSFIGDRAVEAPDAGADANSARRPERLTDIEDRMERNRRQSRDFQTINGERLRVEGAFKPWQWGVYAALFESWRMARIIESTQEAMRMRYERDASLLELRVARSARRQNAILLSLVSLQIFSVGLAIGDAARPLAASGVDFSDWGTLVALGAPLAGLVIGLAVTIALLRENR